jgi:ParB-like chromosome segregation protein Spo0J
LVDGERRLRAVKLLGNATIDAIVNAIDPKEAALRGCVANAQRENLNPIEQAQAYQKLADPPFKLNQNDIADMIGKDRSLVSRYLSIAKLAEGHPEKCASCTNLGLSHFLELARLPKAEDQVALAEEASKKELSVPQLKVLVDQKLGKPASASKGSTKRDARKAIDAALAGDGFKFAAEGTRVIITASIDRYGDGDLEAFFQKLQSALFLWIGQHPCSPKPKPDPDKEPKENAAQDEVSEEEIQAIIAKGRIA